MQRFSRCLAATLAAVVLSSPRRFRVPRPIWHQRRRSLVTLPALFQVVLRVLSANPREVQHQSFGSGAGSSRSRRGPSTSAADAPMKIAACQLPGPSSTSTAMGGSRLFTTGSVESACGLTLYLLATSSSARSRGGTTRRSFELNKNLKLPSRNSSSPTAPTGPHTDILRIPLHVNAEWKAKVGRGASVQLAGRPGAKGNLGVAGIVKQPGRHRVRRAGVPSITS